ncbi:Small heat shock protein C2 [Linum perenne]
MDAEMAASRRMKVVAGHFTPAIDELFSPPHTAASACILPMNCSSNVLNTIMPPRRCDNRMYFARQSSSSQSFFMRQQATSPQQGCGLRKQERPLRCSASGNETPSSAPLFSRPKNIADPNSCRKAAVAPSNKNFVHSSRMYELPDYSRPCSSSPLLPEFAKPAIRSNVEKQLPSSAESKCSSRSSGTGWSPKMDVSESAAYFLVTVEIPGGDISDMRVEVDDHNLRIMGKKCLPAAASMALPTYHRREILQGPYQIMWPLPSCTNKDSVSAEFVNGLLHITVPKL